MPTPSISSLYPLDFCLKHFLLASVVVQLQKQNEKCFSLNSDGKDRKTTGYRSKLSFPCHTTWASQRD